MRDYRLDERLAQNIVERTMKIIDCNINIMDGQGRIIGSGDGERLGELHAGALLAISQGRIVEIDEDASRHLQGVKPGINLPLHLDGNIIGVIGLTGDPQTLHKYGLLVCMTAEMMLEQSQLIYMLAQNTRLQEELVLNLIRAEQISPMLMQWAKRLAIDLTQQRVAIIVEIESGQLGVDSEMAELQQLQTLLADYDKENIIAIVCLTQLVILTPALTKSGQWNAESHRQRLQKLMHCINTHSQLNVRLAVGNYFPEPAGVSYSYRTACTTIHLGKYCFPDRRIYLYQDLVLPVLLDSLRESWQAEEFYRPLTRLRLMDSNGLLMKTINTWYKCDLSSTVTAKTLFIHRNTLEYRLKRISQITGLNLGYFGDQVLLYIALQLDNTQT